MNARGEYGPIVGRGRSTLGPRGRGASVGSELQHVLELSQRYEGVSAAGMQALLNGIGADGVISSTSANNWQVALRAGPWALLAWDPNYNVLRVTITDKRRYPAQQVAAAKSYFEKILRETIAPRLATYGAVAVGLTVYHSVGERADAVKQMDIDWNALYQNLASQVGELTRDPASPSGYHITTQHEWDANTPDPKKVEWWKSYASPLIKQWTAFKREQLGGDRTVADNYIAFAERFHTNWDVYEGWKKKLDNLRAEAQRRGFSVATPAATELPTTVWADAAGVAEKGVGDVWAFLKYGAWAVLGIGTVVVLSSVTSNLRSGRDPAEKYVGLIQARRARQLALPAGESA